MRKIKVDVNEISGNEVGESNVSAVIKPAISIGGGCSCWAEGTAVWWRAASGNLYRHLGASGAYGDCISKYVYFYHITGSSGWHYCP
jgi:hypothetical protein